MCVAVVQGGRRNTGPEPTRGSYKAFVTVLLLTGSLSLFWLPYMLFHFVSAHVLDTDNEQDISDTLIYLKCYVIDFLPMLNFLADPLIYGLRMPEVRRGYRRLARRIFCCRICASMASPSSPSHFYSETASMRRYQMRTSMDGGRNSVVRLSTVYVYAGANSRRESQTTLMMTYVGGGRRASKASLPV
jgi:hypothetical protein